MQAYIGIFLLIAFCFKTFSAESIFSAMRKGPEAVQRAIDAGADINELITYRDRRAKQSPLHVAVMQKRPEVVKVLIDAGVDVNRKDGDGIEPLNWATTTEMANIFIGAGADVRKGILHTVLGRARGYIDERERVELTRLYIKNGADVNSVGDYGKTPIFDAKYLFDAERNPQGLGLVELLLENGADVTKVNKEGQTPLHNLSHLTENLANIFIEAGADVNAKDNNGRTPLHSDGYMTEKLVKDLIGAGADVNAKDNKGRNPLHFRNNDDVGAIRVLIEAGTNVNAKDNNGRTPLFSANTKEVVGLLIEAGVDVNTKDNDGKTFLDLVKSGEVAIWHRGKEAVIKMLEQASAKENTANRSITSEKSKEDNSAACEYQSSSKVKLLQCGQKKLCIAEVSCDFTVGSGPNKGVVVSRSYQSVCQALSNGKCPLSAIRCLLDRSVVEDDEEEGDNVPVLSSPTRKKPSGGTR